MARLGEAWPLKQRALAFRSHQPYRRGMPSYRTELRSLRNLISEADSLVSTASLPENRTARCREVLRSALALTDDLLTQSTPSGLARQLGAKGGRTTAKKGSEYFRQLAAKRTTFGGGRPSGS